MEEIRDFLDGATLVLIVVSVFIMWVFDIPYVAYKFMEFLWTTLS
jgi:hypothetical protein